MKLTKRKGFNFFRSYFDVYNELEDADKVAFMDALLYRQFLGSKPENLEGMAKFAYISQTNSIDSQVKGYEDKLRVKLDGSQYHKEGFDDKKQPLNKEKNTPTDGGKNTPTEQEKEKEKVQDVCLFSEEDFLNLWNNLRTEILKKPSNRNRIGNLDAKANFNDLKNIYGKEDFTKAIKGLFKQQLMPNGNEVMRTDPKHLLTHFERYITAYDERNDKLYGEKQKTDRL